LSDLHQGKTQGRTDLSKDFRLSLR